MRGDIPGWTCGTEIPRLDRQNVKFCKNVPSVTVLCVCVCIFFMYVQHLYVRVYVRMYACTYVRLYVYVCVPACISSFMYVYLHVYVDARAGIQIVSLFSVI